MRLAVGGRVAAGTAVVLAVAVAGCGHPAGRPAVPAASGPPVSAWQQVLRGIGPHGKVSRDTALGAFALAIGQLPGVTTPTGPRQTIPSGTAAVEWTMRYWSTLTPEQRQAATFALTGEKTAAKGTDPDLDCQSADSPDARSYGSALDNAIAAIAGHLGRSMTLPVYLVVNRTQQENADTLAYTVYCTTPKPGCTIHLNPSSFQGGYGPADIPATLTHEAMHCFEYAKFGSDADNLAPWLSEGMATWVAGTLSTAARTTAEWWTDYLDTMWLNVFARSYDAVGFYAHLEETGTDVWSRLDPMDAAYLGAYDALADVSGDSVDADEAAFKAAGPSDEFYSTWGSGLARGRFPGGKAWDLTGPGLPAYDPKVSTFQVGNGDAVPVEAAPGPSAGLVLLDLTAEVVGFGGNDSVRGRLGTADGVDHPLGSVLGQDFCTNAGRCRCPDGTAGAGTVLTYLAPGKAYLGVTAGLDDIQASVAGSTLDDYCGKDGKPTCPNQPKTGSYACYTGPDLNGTITGIAACGFDNYGTVALGDSGGNVPILDGLEVRLYVETNQDTGQLDLNLLLAPAGSKSTNSVGVDEHRVRGNAQSGYTFDHAHIGPYIISGYLHC